MGRVFRMGEHKHHNWDEGKSMKKDVLADLNPTSNYIVGMDISQITPLVVSDGLLVRASK